MGRSHQVRDRCTLSRGSVGPSSLIFSRGHFSQFSLLRPRLVLDDHALDSPDGLGSPRHEPDRDQRSRTAALHASVWVDLAARYAGILAPDEDRLGLAVTNRLGNDL